MGNVAFDNSKDRETDFKYSERKKIYSSALQNVPELKRGGGGRRMITLYSTTPRFKCASTVVKTLFKIYEQV